MTHIHSLALHFWKPELLNSTPPDALWTLSSVFFAHAHTQKRTRAHTQTRPRRHESLDRDLPSGHVSAASFSCWLTRQVNCSNTFTHMSTCMPSGCTCHLSAAVLPLPHFVLPVHHLYSSSSAGSWKDSSGTLLSVCVKGFRPAAWRHFAHPPLSSSDPPVL